MSNIHPTGSCFEDSILWLRERCLTEPGAWTRYQLVHSLIRDEHGRVHSHSWVEDPNTDTVWTLGIVNGERVEVNVDRAAFRHRMGAHDVTAYSLDEALALERSTGHPPPWEPRYRELCAGYVPSAPAQKDRM